MAQVALATILLVTAGLMTRSLRELLAADLGFRADRVVTMRLTSVDTSARHARIRAMSFYKQLARMPGVLVSRRPAACRSTSHASSRSRCAAWRDADASARPARWSCTRAVAHTSTQ